MAIEIKSGASTDALTVDATSKAARVTLYDATGAVITPTSGSAITATAPVLLNGGADGFVARPMRVGSTGSAAVADDPIYFFDSHEGAAYDSRKWIQTVTTQTVTQSAGVLTFNAGSSVATTTGALMQTQRFFPVHARGGLVFKCRARATAHFNNSVIELGFGVPTSSTSAVVTNGAFWRKNSSGQWVPVVAHATSESLGTPIDDATFVAAVPTTDWAHFEVFLQDDRATFEIRTQAGVVVSRQTVLYSTNGGNAYFTATHQQAYIRTLHVGATGTAVQLLVSGVIVQGIDTVNQRPYDLQLVGNNHGSMSSPTAYTQLATYANNAAAGTLTLSNTSAGANTTLGGLFNFAAPAGAASDYIIFAYTVPSPFSFYVRRIKCFAFTQGAAVATTPTLIQWAFSVDASGASLATGGTYPPMRKTIGAMSAPVGAAVGSCYDRECEWNGLEVTNPGRVLVVFCRIPTGTATASQTVQGGVSIDGFFE